MPLRLIRIPWAGQPHGIDAGVDWENPLTSGLVALYTPTTGVLRPQPVATTWAHQNAPVVPHPQGLALQTNAAARHGVSLGPVSTLFPSGHSAGTVLVFRQCLDTTARQSALFGYNVSVSNRVLAHAPWSDGNLYWDFGDHFAGSGRLAVPFAKSLAPETIAFVAASGLRQVWRNGVLLGSNAGNATVPANPNNFGFGWVDGLDRRSDNDDLFQCAVFGRALTAAEIQAWSADPWQLFEAQRIWVPVPLGAPAEPSLAVQGLAHGHTLGALDLVQQHTLAVEGLAHTHTLGAVDLTQQHLLAVEGLAHGHTLAGVTLTVDTEPALVVEGLAHAHTLDSVDLVQQHLLAVQGLSHTHALGAVDLVQQHTLAVAGLSHAHTLGAVTLTPEVEPSLAVQGLIHGHTVSTAGLVAVRIARMEFALSRRSLAVTMTQRSMTFAMSRRSMTFSLATA